MSWKSIAAGIVGSALLAGAAFAEPPAALSESSLQGNWRASKVVGLSVYNESNEKIGSINDLVMDKSGAIKAAVIGVGGFLGMGEHLVAVSFDKVKFSTEPIVYTGASNTNPPGSPPAPAGRPAPTTTTGSTATTNSSAPATMAKPNPWYPDHAVLNTTKDELKNMTEFKYSTE
jgi:sporulation protein YlmC with PRC-barrel domain